MNINAGAAIILGSIFAGIFATFMVLIIIWYILQIIANWRVFKKAGEPGWKSLIPIYNQYIALKIVKMRNWFWWVIGCSICAGIMIAFDGTNPFLMNEAQLQVYDWGAHPMVLFATVMISFVCVYTGIVHAYRLSKVFGHGIGFTLGLIFLQPIFLMILGFGPSKYDKKRLRKQ